MPSIKAVTIFLLILSTVCAVWLMVTNGNGQIPVWQYCLIVMLANAYIILNELLWNKK